MVWSAIFWLLTLCWLPGFKIRTCYRIALFRICIYEYSTAQHIWSVTPLYTLLECNLIIKFIQLWTTYVVQYITLTGHADAEKPVTPFFFHDCSKESHGGESRISPTDTHSLTKYFLTKTISCYVTMTLQLLIQVHNMRCYELTDRSIDGPSCLL